MPKRSISQKVGEKAELICESLFMDAANWIPRRPERDYGVDLEVELTTESQGSEILTGKILKIQVKGSIKPREYDNAIWIRVSKEYLRYASEFRVPVLLVTVNVNTRDTYFVWLQEYLLQNPIENDGTKSKLIKVAKQNRLKDNLEYLVPKIAVGDNDTARLLAFRELVEIFRQSANYNVFQNLLEILKAFEPNQDVWIFEKTLDQLIDLGPNAGVLQTQKHIPVLIQVCRSFGDKLTKDQIIRMIKRGESYSRAGLCGLATMYDYWPDTTGSYKFAAYFDEHELYELARYCRFREFHTGTESEEIWLTIDIDGKLRTDFSTGIGVLTINDQNRSYASSKWPTRGGSIYLDCLTHLWIPPVSSGFR